MIYVTEPSTTGGVGAMGMRILIGALERAGHVVRRVRLFGSVRQARGTQTGLFDTTSAGELPTPDAWFVSCIYPRQWWSIPKMHDMMGLPRFAADRKATDPLVVYGGQSMIAPAPIEAFADVIALGDGEVTGVRIADLIATGMPKPEIIAALSGEVGFSVNGSTLRRAESTHLLHPVVYGEGRNSPIVEVARGCRSKCAFCPIGWAGGTYREPEKPVVRNALMQLRGKRVNVFAPDYSSISWVDDLEHEISRAGCSNASRDARLDATLRAGTAIKSYSFGIEGASERLRKAIGKPMPAERLIEGVIGLSERGAKELRLYMIFGFPGEVDADYDELRRCLDEIIPRLGKTRLDITQTHLQCVPHTPFERLPNRYDTAAVGRASALRAWLREKHERTGKVVLASQPKGVHLHEQDAWLQRATRAATRVLLETKRTWLQDGRWRDVAARHVDIDAELDGAHLVNSTPWDHVKAAAPNSKAKALRNYWAALEQSSGSRRTACARI